VRRMVPLRYDDTGKGELGIELRKMICRVWKLDVRVVEVDREEVHTLPGGLIFEKLRDLFGVGARSRCLRSICEDKR